jgi:hypothetical protein
MAENVPYNIDRRYVMRKATLRNFHVPLPEDLYIELRAEAERSGQPATVLARDAIQLWLQHRQKIALHEAIADYAAQHAGSPADLDEELEAASIDHLLAEEDIES